MNKKQAKERIEYLRKTVEYHAKKYYDDDKPEIPDFEYDMLMVELRNLEKDYPEFVSTDSLTQKVGGHVKEGFEKVTHEVPLQSLQDIFSFEEIDDFVQKIEQKAKEKNIELTEKDRVNITVFGMVKNDKHQTRALMNDKREELEISQTLLNTITMFQDAVHDTAIGYHKKLRNEEVTRSALDNIKGIGIVKKVELLKKFGTVENISNASVEEIAEVKGINEELAVEIKNALIH